MTITNGYCSLAEIKNFLRIVSTDTNDDSVLEQLVEGSSRLIDIETRRTFYARSETHYYNVPESRELWIDDDDLLAITTLTNGDTTTISNTEYNLIPANTVPKYAIVLKEGSLIYWQYSSAGNSEMVISVAATWGYSSTTPTDIKVACMRIAERAYHNRFGENAAESTTITASGVVLTPADIPASAARLLASYRRL
jgi:hypothetical protein